MKNRYISIKIRYLKTIITFFPIFILSVSPIFGQSKNDYLLRYEDDSCLCFGYKNKKGDTIIKAKYFYADDTFRTCAFVYEDSQFKMIDREQHFILQPFIFDNGPDYVVEGVFRFIENNKIGFANLNGEKVIPAQFDMVYPFNKGIAEYVLGGRKEDAPGGEHWIWVGGYETGYINHIGQHFTKVSELKKGQRDAWTTDGRQVILNKKGEIIKYTKEQTTK